jgi:hypothetical protein
VVKFINFFEIGDVIVKIIKSPVIFFLLIMTSILGACSGSGPSDPLPGGQEEMEVSEREIIAFYKDEEGNEKYLKVENGFIYLNNEIKISLDGLKSTENLGAKQVTSCYDYQGRGHIPEILSEIMKGFSKVEIKLTRFSITDNLGFFQENVNPEDLSRFESVDASLHLIHNGTIATANMFINVQAGTIQYETNLFLNNQAVTSDLIISGKEIEEEVTSITYVHNCSEKSSVGFDYNNNGDIRLKDGNLINIGEGYLILGTTSKINYRASTNHEGILAMHKNGGKFKTVIDTTEVILSINNLTSNVNYIDGLPVIQTESARNISFTFDSLLFDYYDICVSFSVDSISGTYVKLSGDNGDKIYTKTCFKPDVIYTLSSLPTSQINAGEEIWMYIDYSDKTPTVASGGGGGGGGGGFLLQ